MTTQVTVAIVQAQPAYYDLHATVEKAIGYIQQAASKGAQLVTFGETWFPGYPKWLDYSRDAALWDHEPVKNLYVKLHTNSMALPSEAFNVLAQKAKELEIVLVLSINERVEGKAGHGTLYNSLITIDTTGQLVNHHRKLIPTYTERLVWGAGDAYNLRAVDTSVGRVGGLICWEHWMPMARQTLHNSAEQIHIAVWPTVGEMHQIASRHYAFEGRTFVLAAGSLLSAKALPDTLEKIDMPAEMLLQQGGSAIIAPDGRYLAGPVFDEEAILTATLDFDEIIKESMTLDVTGHYSRPELFDFSMNRTGK